MAPRGLTEVRFTFDHDGSVVIATELTPCSAWSSPAGSARAMRPSPASVPKALLPVAGEPFAAHQLALLSRAGVSESSTASATAAR